MDPMVNQFEGYGEVNLAERDELLKALQAQEGVTDISNLQDGGALQPQSLETTLAMLTFQEKQIKFFKDIKISKAFSTLEEYTVQDGLGTEGGFVGQLENPEEGDPDFRREFAVVKYVRTLWKVADVLQYAKTITSAEVKAVQAAMLRAMRTTEKTLFFGDSSVIPQSFDGVEKTILDRATTQHIIDLRGGSISEAIMKQAAELIASNYGTPTDMYLSNSTQTTIDNLLIANNAQRYNQEVVSSGSGLISLGHSVIQMRTSFGNFNFKPDIFINPESQGVPMIKNPSNPSTYIEGATSAKAPASPSVSVAVDAPTVTGSKWASSGDGGAIAGSYRYRVVAINQYGKSAASTASSAQTVAADGALTLTITAGGGAYAATGYEIYREDTPASGNYRYMKSIAVTGATDTYQDLNEDLPGKSKSFLVDNSASGEYRTMSLAQLAPMHKVEYAKIAPYRWGTVNFYAVPKWYAPLRMVMFKNIGIGKEIRNPVIDL